MNAFACGQYLFLLCCFVCLSCEQTSTSSSGTRNSAKIAVIRGIDGDSLRRQQDTNFWLPSVSNGSPNVIQSIGNYVVTRDSVIKGDTLLITSTTIRSGTYRLIGSDYENVISFTMSSFRSAYNATIYNPKILVSLPFPMGESSNIEILGGKIRLEWTDRLPNGNKQQVLDSIPFRLSSSGAMLTQIELLPRLTFNTTEGRLRVDSLRFRRRKL